MEEKSLNEILKELFEIAKSLSSTLDLDTLLKRIGDAAEKLTESEASSIMLLDEDKKHLSFKVATGEKSGIMKTLKVKVGEGIAGTIAQTKESLIINDVSKDKRFANSFDKSSGFKTRSILGVPLLIGDELIGVAEVLNKRNGDFNEDDKEILQSLASLASVTILNARFSEDQKNFFIYIIEIIVQAIESRDPKITGHTWRVAQISTAIARAFGIEKEEYKNIYFGALLHDIGYLVGSKTMDLGQGIYGIQHTDLDKQHSLFGWEMVRKINILRNAAPIVKYHHENFDGSGYPEGLKGEEIPFGANIVALAEYVDELKIIGYSNEKIYEMVKLNRSKKFRPDIVDLFINKKLLPEEEITGYA